MDKRSEKLGNKKIGSLLFELSFPAAIGMIVQGLYNVVDAIFVGRGVGPMGIAGIAIVFPIQMLIMAIAGAIGIGGASIVSRSLGARNKARAERTMGNIFSLSLIIGIATTVLGLIYINPLLKLFGSTAAILPYARDYMSVILLGAVFSIFSMSMNNIVRAEGNAKVAMGTMLLGAIANIILDPIFIFSLHMGIKGAAVATVISKMLSTSYLIFYFFSGKSVMKFYIKYLKLDKSVVGETFSIGASSIVRQGSGSVLVAILNNTLAFYGGSMAITVYGLINRLTMFTRMPAVGIAQGFQPIAGFNYAAKKYDRVKKGMLFASIGATIIMAVGFLLMEIFPAQLIGMFTTDQTLIASSIVPLRIIAVTLPLIGFTMIVSTFFQSLGKAVQAFILALSRQIIFMIPLVLILPRFFHLDGVWYSFPLTNILSVILAVTLFVLETKKLNRDANKQKTSEVCLEHEN